MSDPIAQLKHELLVAAERQHAQPAAVRAGLRRWRLWGENRLLQAAVAVAIVAAAVLFATSPWKSSPGFLERAEAALTPPAGAVLHMKWVTELEGDCQATRGPDEVWLDQMPPHRIRFLSDPPVEFDDFSPRCSNEPPIEFGGTLNASEMLEFQPPNTLIRRPVNLVLAPDPVSTLREAIVSGLAHDEGTVQLDGRTLRRIRIDPSPTCSSPNCVNTPAYTYVDPETFYPVADECDCGIVPGRSRLNVKTRYLEFEYLPRTAENEALADIRAQHPNATER